MSAFGFTLLTLNSDEAEKILTALVANEVRLIRLRRAAEANLGMIATRECDVLRTIASALEWPNETPVGDIFFVLLDDVTAPEEIAKQFFMTGEKYANRLEF